MKHIELQLTDKQFEDLCVLVDLCYDTFDFHGDFIPMQEPLDKLKIELDALK